MRMEAQPRIQAQWLSGALCADFVHASKRSGYLVHYALISFEFRGFVKEKGSCIIFAQILWKNA